MTIFKHQPEMPVQRPYVEMARVVAQRHGIPIAPGFSRPLKVIIAARQPGEERFLTNADDMAKVTLPCRGKSDGACIGTICEKIVRHQNKQAVVVQEWPHRSPARHMSELSCKEYASMTNEVLGGLTVVVRGDDKADRLQLG